MSTCKNASWPNAVAKCRANQFVDRLERFLVFKSYPFLQIGAGNKWPYRKPSRKSTGYMGWLA